LTTEALQQKQAAAEKDRQKVKNFLSVLRILIIYYFPFAD